MVFRPSSSTSSRCVLQSCIESHCPVGSRSRYKSLLERRAGGYLWRRGRYRGSRDSLAAWVCQSCLSKVADQTFIDPPVQRGAPRFKINAGLQGNWNNGLNAEAVVHYVDSASYPADQNFLTFAGLGLIPSNAVPSSRVGHYTFLNLRFGYRFWQDHAEAAISVFNALNERHQEHPLADRLGSRVMGWLSLKL